jgi:ABC-type branched-subunit amino acid transport system substrate-binding protein
MGRKTCGLLLVLVLIAAGCADRSGEDDASDGGSTDDSTGASGDQGGGEGSFGTIEAPCGPQDPGTAAPGSTDAAETQGTADGTLQIGTVADPGYEGRPGLDQELFDASEAFVAWCNEQGGINGRQIELTLYDAAITEYQARLGEACDQEFAMVGGGAITDNQWTATGQACGLIDVPAFAVTPEKAGLASADQIAETRTIQAIPNPSNEYPVGAARILADDFPDAPGRSAIIYGDLATTIVQKDRIVEAQESIGYEFIQETSHNILGEASWAPFAAAIEEDGITYLNFVGDGAFFAPLQQAMAEQGYTPEVVQGDTNIYQQEYLDQAGDAADGTYTRLAFWPFEEAAENPATQRYLDLTEESDGKVALLGAQSMSAWLLFAQLATTCDVEGDFTRSCILDAAGEVTEWDGGGLHAPTNPAENSGPVCTIVLQVEGGEFVRYAPAEVDGGEDGYDCDPANLVELEGDFSVSG